MRRFLLNRKIDDSGISGVGLVAEACEYGDKKCVLRWLGRIDSFEFFNSIEELIEIHGHQGHSQIVWIDK